MEGHELQIQTFFPRTGAGIFNIAIRDNNRKDLPNHVFEIYLTEDFMIKRNPNFGELDIREKINQLEDAAENLYKNRKMLIDYADERVGLVVTDSGIQCVNDPEEFVAFLKKVDELIQTNISLPQSLHVWTKVESARTKKSISELIRLALVQYKQHSFICTRCGRKKYGLPFFQDQTRQHCRECFLKAFEEVRT
jgi:hypothetical protein